jgi:type II secretory pathway component GspD/PulD (secretin)
MSQMLNGVSSTGGTFSSSPTIVKENARGTTEDVLIKLITNTIAPQSWASVGGPGTIDFFPLGGALVINQTPDIQEQVAELLQALRRLQDQEVAVEVRFITVAEAFFERIGLDFNINIRNNQTRYEPQIVSQQFKPFGFINHFTPSNFVAGLTPAGAGGSSQTPGQNFTQDLNIPVHNSSFGMAVPPFGDFPSIPGGNGGLSFGLAFLSDIEVYLFMEAAQGDIRTNVMTAPKLTMFNGQTATLTVTDQQFFTTSVTVAQVGGQVVFVPSNNPIPTGGVTLTMSSVISADRRFVRMSLTPALTNLASANVPLFPITTFITPIFEGGAVGQPVPFTQFLQQPTINTITINTTVNVPDGGTVLMGGLKRLSEGRNEFGPPILSKIPYLDRLFKNVGYGRDAESLLMMVTPRIIINEEEELRQVPGALPPPGGAGGGQ